MSAEPCLCGTEFTCLADDHGCYICQPDNPAAAEEGCEKCDREHWDQVLSGMTEHPDTCPSPCAERSHPGREHNEMTDGCRCTELCAMGPTCPGANAGLPRGCWRTGGDA